LCGQGVTADTTHAVLSETATRALSYVAMTRGRHTNAAYFYQRTREHEYRDESTQAGHVEDGTAEARSRDIGLDRSIDGGLEL
jgi:hypothetical protein